MDSVKNNASIPLMKALGNKRDGLVLLSGMWGCGKTYYVMNVFYKIYTLKSKFYISLLGVKNIEDFKAKIINTYYLENARDFGAAINLTSNLLGVATTNIKTVEAIKGVFNSIESSIRESVLSKLNGLFIIDDLERVDNETVLSDILNYCLSLYKSNADNKLDFLLIGNYTNESGLSIKHSEKIVTDTVCFSPTHDYIRYILMSELSFMSDDNRDVFFDFLKNQNMSNIRIINRIIEKLIPIFKLYEENASKNKLINLNEIIVSISSAIVVAYVYNQKYENFISFRDISTFDDSMLDDQAMLVRTLMQSAIGYNTKNLVPYVFNMQSLEDIKQFLFEDIWHPTPRDIALSKMPHFSGIDEKVLVTVLVALIKKDVEIDIK